MQASQKISSGLLMYSVVKQALEVFLVHPGGPFFAKKDEGYWGIPKGEAEQGEDLLTAAIREFTEETGLAPSGPYVQLGSVRLKSGKIVYAWAFAGEWPAKQALVSNTCWVEWPLGSGRQQEIPEIDQAGFFTLEQAGQKISEAQQPFIKRLEEYLQQKKL